MSCCNGHDAIIRTERTGTNGKRKTIIEIARKTIMPTQRTHREKVANAGKETIKKEKQKQGEKSVAIRFWKRERVKRWSRSRRAYRKV